MALHFGQTCNLYTLPLEQSFPEKMAVYDLPSISSVTSFLIERDSSIAVDRSPPQRKQASLHQTERLGSLVGLSTPLNGEFSVQQAD